MKLLCSSDWHGDAVTLGKPRFKDVEAAVRETVDVAIKKKVDRYLFLGDLCDPDSGVSVFRCVGLAIEVARTLSNNAIPSIWLAGNHDVIEDGSGETTMTPLRGLDDSNIQVIEQPKAFGTFLALPFTATSHAYDARKFVTGILDSKHLPPQFTVLSHLSMPGVQPGEETTDMPRGRDIEFPLDLFPEGRTDALILQGHYHRQQRHVFQGSAPVHIPGSLERLTFGEQGHEPSYLLIEA